MGKGQFLFRNDFNQLYLAVNMEEYEGVEQQLSTEATGTAAIDIKFMQTMLGLNRLHRGNGCLGW